ncbi:hypothetical protein [Streptomyces achromogenes]|uniref:hypothetical protein n=1 Tax=Streptomyces achromogenes TaxID=67255 RepID=UPI003683AF84
MSTPEERPNLEAALVLAQVARAKLAAALDQPQAPGAGDPRGWQPVRKRPREPKSKAAKKAEPRRQRGRLEAAGRRRLATGQSRRSRPRQNRIGNAAARRDARALSRERHSSAWL